MTSNYGMGGYVGSAEDQRRIYRQEQQRQQQRRQYEDARKKSESALGLRQFGSGTSEAVEHAFKSETVGLVTRDEFVEKRQTIEERLKTEAKRKRDAEEEEAWTQREEQRIRRAKSIQKSKLSFHDEESLEDDMFDKEQTQIAVPAARKYATLGKDPTVKTEFLPDKDREKEEEALRIELEKEWVRKQAEIKLQPLEITYSYWDGSGHRNHVTVKRGDTVATFLRAVQEQLAPRFREIRSSSVSNLMYIKEDVILPHNVTFYDLIVNRAQGRSGPLFQFDLQEKAAATFDPRLKSQDSHAGKVVERHWYSRNKHIFPYSLWEVYDPDKPVTESEPM
jgi:protein FAM50